MAAIELSAGTISYQDSGGDGTLIVFVHGVLMDGSVWDSVTERLTPEFRCVRPTWPLGSHLHAMNPGADLSLQGIALLVGEFLERLDLRNVILVQNDWGGAQVLIANGSSARIAKLVLAACEAFDNYPPGLPGRAIERAARIPGGLALLMRALRLTAVRRAPGSWGWMSKRPVPRSVMDRWFRPATTDHAVRSDLGVYCRSTPDRTTLLRWAQANVCFDRPVLVVWAAEDKIMPRAHGERLADLYPQGRLVMIEDSYTLIPLDQPTALADCVAQFARTDS